MNWKGFYIFSSLITMNKSKLIDYIPPATKGTNEITSPSKSSSVLIFSLVMLFLVIGILLMKWIIGLTQKKNKKIYS